MASSPQITILEPEGTKWRLSESTFNLNVLDALPKQCYVFLDVKNYPPADGRRERLLAHFGVPDFVANKTCFELNGYFGTKPSYDEQSPAKQLTSYTTWFRCLIKMVRKVDDDPHDNGPEYATDNKDYKWFETSVFTRWDRSNTSQALCVDTPPDFPSELQKLLAKQAHPLNVHDPFAMHVSLLDQLIVYCDISVWRVRDPVRQLEKARMRTGAIFGPIHEMSRHAIHTTEILKAAIETLTEMQHCRAAVLGGLRNELGDTYRAQVESYAQFQISLLKSLKLRSESNQERLKNEINLAFNNLARQDNSVMKSIALLTMIFLPATFISALFSTTFFSFAGDGSWQVSDRLWVYWAVTIPGTIVIVVLWRIWLAKNDAILRFVAQYLAWWRNLKIGLPQLIKDKREGQASAAP